MQALSRREEEKLLKETKAKALKACDDVVKAFAACSQNRTVSIAWACRSEHKAMQECLLHYTGPDAWERTKLEYLRTSRPSPTSASAAPSGASSKPLAS